VKGLQKLFDPKSIAVIGASNEQGSIGLSLMKNLVGSGYKGTVYPVNPNRKNVFGIRCYKSVLTLPEEIDLAIVATHAKIVPIIIKQCIKAKTKSIIVVSSGFGEIGKEGKMLEKEVKKILRGTGVRLLGPNCLGYIRTDKKINASFAIRNALPGKIALISQSGALCSGILDWALKQNVGFKYFISIGAMLDVDFSDLIEFIQKDKKVESIAVYMETIKDAKAFMKAATKFSKKRPIIVAKSGRFDESARAAISHTGSMAGDDEVFDAAFERAGIVRVENIQELVGCSQALAKQPLPKGNRIAIITNAGGPGVMATDAIIQRKCKLAHLSKRAMKALEKEMPMHWSRGNPIDLLGDAGPDRYKKAIEIVLKEKNVDGIVVILSPQAISKPVEVAKAIAEKISGTSKTVLACWFGENFVEKGREILRKMNVPCYRTPESAIRVFSYMNSYRENIKNLYEAPVETELKVKPDKEKINGIIASYLKRGQIVVNEIDSKEILREYGIPINKTFLSKNAKQAVKEAEQIGFPVAMKVVSDEITHKTDIGGVALNIVSKKEVESQFKKIIKNAKRVRGAKIKGVSVQKMIEAGNIELIIGKKNDSVFGAVIIFGTGGIATEIFKDKSIGLPPLNQNLARRMIKNTKVNKLLNSPRIRLKADVSEITGILTRFSHFVVDFPEVEEVDINPIIVSKGKFYAVDARMVLTRHAKKGFEHLAIMPSRKK